MDRWRGKVAIVTGASAGIGAKLAEYLVEEGLQVVGFARRVHRMEELSQKLQSKTGKFHPFKVDITSEEEILEGFKWVKENLGPVSILVNNAGILQDTTLIDGDTQKWRKIIDTDVMGLCIATREAIRSMRENSIDGHIIHMNSIGGHSVPNIPGFNIYIAAKHAVTALTETLRQELNRLESKIKISSISPGTVETEIVDAAGFKNDPRLLSTKLPTLYSEDIANAVIYVLSTPPHVQVHEMIIKPVGEPV